MELKLPLADLTLKTLTVEELRVRSKNGRHYLTLMGMDNGVAVYLEDGLTGDTVSLSSQDDKSVVIGIYSGNDQEKKNPMTLAITLVEGRPTIQVVVNNEAHIMPLGPTDV
jgi:hypothetical protein